MDLTTILIIAIVVVSTAIIFYIYKKISTDKKLAHIEKQIQSTIDESNQKVKQILSRAQQDATEHINKSRHTIEEEMKLRRKEIDQAEQRMMQKEKHLDTRELHLSEKENILSQETEKVKNTNKKQEAILVDLVNKLEQVASLSREEAQKYLLANVEQQIKKQAGILIKQTEEKAKKVANRKATEIILEAIQKTALEHTVNSTTSVVILPDEEMKGRIIGREGRNIRAFESLTGVDVIIDDSPGTVVLSAFDPIRRETARLAMAKLVSDGRIHPTRIEEMVEKSRQELTETIKEKGEKAAEVLGLQFHPKIIELLGKLHFRTSYGQNVLEHSMETAILASTMASELNVNINLTKRGGLLHDIGKALDFEQEGSHAKLGTEISAKYKESPEICNCIMAHHGDVKAETIEAVLVSIADAISSTRPGARKESMELYIKRLERLEALASSFDGVEKTYAIQAGREIRIMVKSDEIDDASISKLAFDIAQKIEAELEYPGEIKVSVIRETRAQGLAK
jgi:ribonucrease Y